MGNALITGKIDVTYVMVQFFANWAIAVKMKNALEVQIDISLSVQNEGGGLMEKNVSYLRTGFPALFTTKMTTPSRNLRHTAEASLTVHKIVNLFFIGSFKDA